jgi:hypothetical protein
MATFSILLPFSDLATAERLQGALFPGSQADHRGDPAPTDGLTLPVERRQYVLVSDRESGNTFSLQIYFESARRRIGDWRENRTRQKQAAVPVTVSR